jgi:hypothetical protein
MISPQLRRALTWASKLKLTREDRHALGEYLTGHEGSWATMSDEDAMRIADALRAFNAVQWLYADRRALNGDDAPLPRPALAHAS